jgi:hypothetical protein
MSNNSIEASIRNAAIESEYNFLRPHTIEPLVLYKRRDDKPYYSGSWELRGVDRESAATSVPNVLPLDTTELEDFLEESELHGSYVAGLGRQAIQRLYGYSSTTEAPQGEMLAELFPGRKVRELHCFMFAPGRPYSTQARQLLYYTQDRAREKGYDTYALWTSPKNGRACAFYEKKCGLSLYEKGRIFRPFGSEAGDRICFYAHLNGLPPLNYLARSLLRSYGSILPPNNDQMDELKKNRYNRMGDLAEMMQIARILASVVMEPYQPDEIH